MAISGIVKIKNIGGISPWGEGWKRYMNIEVEDKALMYVAKAADGSLRDALSLLDQCVAFHYGRVLTYDNALEVLGAVDSSVFSRMFNAVADGRTRD